MSEANAGGVGGLFLLQASKSPPTRLASLATLPANGREGKGFRAINRCVHPLALCGERVGVRGSHHELGAGRTPSPAASRRPLPDLKSGIPDFSILNWPKSETSDFGAGRGK